MLVRDGVWYAIWVSLSPCRYRQQASSVGALTSKIRIKPILLTIRTINPSTLKQRKGKKSRQHFFEDASEETLAKNPFFSSSSRHQKAWEPLSSEYKQGMVAAEQASDELVWAGLVVGLAQPLGLAIRDDYLKQQLLLIVLRNLPFNNWLWR